ncbi:interleukin-8 [Engraulis encrasicolus]|uniref:interleukin-8 n=1 Tax=Engraulis encrasicolus TaxID=184585 RepID=UPI002FD420E9
MALHSHTLLAAAVLFCGLAFTLALPGDMPRWCRCPRTTGSFISPRHYKKLEIITPGAYCRQTEIIITLKSNKTVCVAPETDWINKVIRMMQRKEDARSTERSPITLAEDGGERL